MARFTLLQKSGAGMIASVALGVFAAVLTIGKSLGWWEVPTSAPMLFAFAGVLGTIVFVVFLVALLRRFRVPQKE